MERTLRIQGLVHGGDGLARDDGRVVFVPLTAPGDLVRAALEPPRGGVTRGRLLDVIEAGPARQLSPCPIAGTCGGCQWQHVSIEAQRSSKEATVRETLSRVGGLTSVAVRPVVASPRTWRYRRRLRAQLTREGWGFSRRASTDTSDVAACLLAESDVERLAHAIAAALHEAGAFPAVATFAVDALEPLAGANAKGAVYLETGQPVSAALRKRVERLFARRIDGLTGIVLGGAASGRTASPVILGQPVLVDVRHRRLRVRPDLFAQANRLGARLMAEAVADTVEAGASVLELFAGAGTLSLFLVERAGRFVATEGEGPSLDLLRTSLRELGREGRLVAGPAARVVAGLADGGELFDHVVLDPPRTGAREILPALSRLARRAITYVSCDAATFARDAGMLARAGWKLREVTPYDLFPHTHHVEVVATFER